MNIMQSRVFSQPLVKFQVSPVHILYAFPNQSMGLELRSYKARVSQPHDSLCFVILDADEIPTFGQLPLEKTWLVTLSPENIHKVGKNWIMRFGGS